VNWTDIPFAAAVLLCYAHACFRFCAAARTTAGSGGGVWRGRYVGGRQTIVLSYAFAPSPLLRCCAPLPHAFAHTRTRHGCRAAAPVALPAVRACAGLPCLRAAAAARNDLHACRRAHHAIACTPRTCTFAVSSMTNFSCWLSFLHTTHALHTHVYLLVDGGGRLHTYGADGSGRFMLVDGGGGLVCARQQRHSAYMGRRGRSG